MWAQGANVGCALLGVLLLVSGGLARRSAAPSHALPAAATAAHAHSTTRAARLTVTPAFSLPLAARAVVHSGGAQWRHLQGAGPGRAAKRAWPGVGRPEPWPQQRAPQRQRQRAQRQRQWARPRHQPSSPADGGTAALSCVVLSRRSVHGGGWSWAAALRWSTVGSCELKG